MHWRTIAILATACVAGAACDREGAGEPADAAGVEARPIDPQLSAHLPEGVTVETAEAGRDLYPECGVCHGLEGEGTELGPPLADGEWIRGSGGMDEIAALIRSGAPSPRGFPAPMPSYGTADYSDEQVRGLAAYVFLLSRAGAAPDTTAVASDTTVGAPDTAAGAPDTAGAPQE